MRVLVYSRQREREWTSEREREGEKKRMGGREERSKVGGRKAAREKSSVVAGISG